MFFAVSAFAQTEAKLVGKWGFVDFQDSPDLDKETREMGMMMFKEFTLEFTADKKAIISLMGKSDTATWKLSDEKTVAVTTDKGKSVNMPLTKVDDKELIISLDGKVAMVMKRL